MGKGELEPLIQVVANITMAEDYVSGKIGIVITYEGVITSIKLEDEEILVPQKVDGKYTVDKAVTENKTYKIIVKNENGKYQIANINVTDITKDTNIYTKEDMIAFKDQVNNGRTYEGKTVKIMNDIDLEGNDSNQWIPISNFKGTFDGQYHVVRGLYINSNKYKLVGLFTKIFTKVENLRLENIYINNTAVGAVITGGIAGYTEGVINNCSTSGTILATNNAPRGNIIAGGITGNSSKSKITNCFNEANVTLNVGTGYWSLIGGIIGQTVSDVSILNCYNKGTIIGNSGEESATGGITGYMYKVQSIILKNCYNIGAISARAPFIQVGGICGRNGDGQPGAVTATNCYYLNTKTPYIWHLFRPGYAYIAETIGSKTETAMKSIGTNLGAEYIADTTNINNGYPILKWQIEKIGV